MAATSICPASEHEEDEGQKVCVQPQLQLLCEGEDPNASYVARCSPVGLIAEEELTRESQVRTLARTSKMTTSGAQQHQPPATQGFRVSRYI
jgi:hypothetical protein